jgi:hypothetical protein
MGVFDVSKNWLILAPISQPAGQSAAREIAVYLGRLRRMAGIETDEPGIKDGTLESQPDSVPVIILNCAGESLDRNGFSWRAGGDRIEIYGDSYRGLWNGAADFLSALGIAWPVPGGEQFPAAHAPGRGVYPLARERAYCHSILSAKARRRLVIAGKPQAKKWERIITWAARNKYDALVIPPQEKALWEKIKRGGGILPALRRYALIVEAGGWTNLLPRRVFLSRDMFRMENGRRARAHNFCPTNPKTIERIQKQAAELFGRAAQALDAAYSKKAGASAAHVFHVWPDRGFESRWCACPACRAFSPPEQNLIAANSAACAIAGFDPQALVSWLDIADQPDSSQETPPVARISPRENMFALSGYPEILE